MKLHAHFLAESANFGADGTFTVFRGGITEVNAPIWPALIKVCVLTRLEFDFEESQGLKELTQRITFNGNEMGRGKQPIALKVDRNKPAFANLIGILNLVIPGPGRITIESWVGEYALPLLHLLSTQAPLPG